MKFLLACMLMFAGMMTAQTSDPSLFKSVYAAQDTTLQLDPAAPFWQEASPVYAERDSRGNLVPGHRTEVRSRWTKSNLYLLFVCPYEELHLKPSPKTRTETNELWHWDVAEIFLGSNFKNIRRYKEFEISPQGEWMDLDVDLSLPNHEVGWVWNSGFQVAARIDRKAKVWYGAMRIPFSALDTPNPVAGTVFRTNIFRGQGPAPRKLLAWQPPMTDTFHTPERFGRLQLVERK